MQVEHVSFGSLHAGPDQIACCHCLILEFNSRVVLVDTGIGLHDIDEPERRIGNELIEAAGFQFNENHTAVSQLASRGISPDDVTDIILTHCDPDHAGGLVDFPQATVHVSLEEYQNLESGHPRYCKPQFEHGPKWRCYDNTNETCLGLYGMNARPIRGAGDEGPFLVPLFGHTRGHCGVALQEDNGWRLHAGDSYYTRRELWGEDKVNMERGKLRADDNHKRNRTQMLLRGVSMVSYAAESEFYCSHDPTELSLYQRRVR